MHAQVGWGTADPASLELGRRRKLLEWAPGTTTRPEKGPLGGHGWCEWWEVRLGQAMAGTVSPPRQWGGGTEQNLLNWGEWEDTRKLPSLLAPPTPLSTPTFSPEQEEEQTKFSGEGGPHPRPTPYTHPKGVPARSLQKHLFLYALPE